MDGESPTSGISPSIDAQWRVFSPSRSACWRCADTQGRSSARACSGFSSRARLRLMAGLADIAADLGVRVTAEPVAGSMSGSHVHAVTRHDGCRAVLKMTTGAEGPELEAGRRELHFYWHLRERVGVRTPELIDYREADDAVALLLTAHPAPLPALRWSRTQWLSLADDLARLHRTPVPAGSQWRRPSWLADTLAQPDLTAAHEFWSRADEPLGSDPGRHRGAVGSHQGADRLLPARRLPH